MSAGCQVRLAEAIRGCVKRVVVDHEVSVNPNTDSVVTVRSKSPSASGGDENRARRADGKIVVITRLIVWKQRRISVIANTTTPSGILEVDDRSDHGGFTFLI